MEKSMKIIARIRTVFPTKFGIPRQSGLADFDATIVFEPEYRNPEALRGIEEFSHLWLLWNFSEAERKDWSPTVRPPRLGGNTRVGVFATRSPFRPNPIGLSSVRLIGVEKTEEGTVLKVSGADLMDGTPIFDIKPYLAFTDSHPDAICGFADAKKSYSLEVRLSDELLEKIPFDKREPLKKLLSEDPRPQYIDDPSRVFGFPFDSFEIKFTVDNGILTVTEIENRQI
ncbi:MAG: tRNA (N6-threonylcarbamoyladenosine(37)-N6)-methyltransferase TrmO [Clostridia bacterium]|nr:tRNA (N6-threonylcarbamoyladenosine(37)-N6)-methyltransferase TrmO [Clostridia bacterium]